MDQQNPYSFILDDKKQRGTRLPGTKQRVAVFAGLVVVLLTAGFVVMSLLSSAGKGSTQLLYKAAAAQADLIDLSGIGSQKARDPQLRTLAATSEATYISQNKALLSIMAKQGIKADKKEIAKYQVNSYKKALEDAETSGTFDVSFAALLTQRADAYRNTLQAAYADQKSQSAKNELAAQYKAVGLLIKRDTAAN